MLPSLFEYTDAGRFQSQPAEQNDCAVRAASLSLGISYEEAHQLMSTWGRPKDRGACLSTIVLALRSRGVHLQRGGFSLAELRRRAPTGWVFVIVRGHAFALYDGVVMDVEKQSPNTRVISYAIVDRPHKPARAEGFEQMSIRQNEIWYHYQKIIDEIEEGTLVPKTRAELCYELGLRAQITPSSASIFIDGVM